MQLARAVPAGSRRATSQRQWKTAALTAVTAQHWYTNRAAHTTAVIGVLARYMDWADRTSRPTHTRIAQMTKLSPRTVTRTIAWLRSTGLLGLVSPGTTPALRPAILHGPPERNDAAVYLLTIPHRHKPPPTPQTAGHSQSDHLSRSRRDRTNLPRTRARGKPRPPADHILRHCPKTRTEQLTAADAIRACCPTAARLTPRHVAWLTRAWFQAGRTPADILHAIDYHPDGHQWHHDTPIRHPAGWLHHRLADWTRDGQLLPTPAQQAAARATHHKAQQTAARRHHTQTTRHTATPDTATTWATRARQTLLDLLTPTPGALTRATAAQRDTARRLHLPTPSPKQLPAPPHQAPGP